MLLDASALMTYLLNEPGANEVLRVISDRSCAVSSVTLTELEGKLVGRGAFTPDQVRAALTPLLALAREVPFDARCRTQAAFYYARKVPYDLSLGDAACLGTAGALGMDVLTAERGWRNISDLPFRVEVIW